MKLNVRALAYALAALCGLSAFIVGCINASSPTYGAACLALAASVYPGYTPDAGFGSILTLTGYAICDGAVGGLLLGWLYNCAAR